jgi:transcriptional regulator with XRE-family HTH domain
VKLKGATIEVIIRHTDCERRVALGFALLRDLVMPRAKSLDPTDVRVGQIIRSQRLVQRLSQVDLANKLGITFQQIQKYEKGTNRISAGRLKQIAEVLGVPVSFFFEGVRGSSIEVENINSSLRFLESAAALRVVRAFAEIGDRKIRQAIVALIEEIAQRERVERSRSGI